MSNFRDCFLPLCCCFEAPRALFCGVGVRDRKWKWIYFMNGKLKEGNAFKRVWLKGLWSMKTVLPSSWVSNSEILLNCQTFSNRPKSYTSSRTLKKYFSYFSPPMHGCTYIYIIHFKRWYYLTCNHCVGSVKSRKKLLHIAPVWLHAWPLLVAVWDICHIVATGDQFAK